MESGVVAVGTTAHKVCAPVKRNNLPPPFSEAAKALLSSPLPPQLVVDFKGLDNHQKNTRNRNTISEIINEIVTFYRNW